MYLLDFKQRFKCREFNPVTRAVGELVLNDSLKTSGFYGEYEFGSMVIYPSNSSLLFDVNDKSWNLLDDNIDTEYFHFYSDKKTRFQVLNNGNVEFEHIYESWWVDRSDFEVNEMAVSCEPENREEDDLAYIDWVKFDQEAAKNLHALWRKSAQGYN